jgi:hypothetical protein
MARHSPKSRSACSSRARTVPETPHAVGNKTAVPGIITKPIDRRDITLCSETDYQFPVSCHEGAGHNNQTRI